MGKLGTCLATGIIFLFFITNGGLLMAGDAILTWDPNANAVAGYKVYYRTASRTYGTPIDVLDLQILNNVILGVRTCPI